MLNIRWFVRLVTGRRRPSRGAAGPIRAQLRAELSLETMSDRLLPSANGPELMRLDLIQELNTPTVESIRFVELIGFSGSLSDQPLSTTPLSSQQLATILLSASDAEQLKAPTTATSSGWGTSERPFLVMKYGSTVSLVVAFINPTQHGASALDTKPAPVGGLVAVQSNDAVRLFFFDADPGESVEPFPHWLSLWSPTATFELAPAASTDHKGPFGEGIAPTDASAAFPDEAVSVPARRTAIGQSAASLTTSISVEPSGSEAPATAEVAPGTLGNPADALLIVDTVLPEARPGLMRLHDAELVVVPSYTVGTAPSETAPLLAHQQSTLALDPIVVGLGWELGLAKVDRVSDGEPLVAPIGAQVASGAPSAGAVCEQEATGGAPTSSEGLLLVAPGITGMLATYAYRRWRRLRSSRATTSSVIKQQLQ